jgi:hypothetical protein
MIFQDVIIRYVVDHWLSHRGNQVDLYTSCTYRLNIVNCYVY